MNTKAFTGPRCQVMMSKQYFDQKYWSICTLLDQVDRSINSSSSKYFGTKREARRGTKRKINHKINRSERSTSLSAAVATPRCACNPDHAFSTPPLQFNYTVYLWKRTFSVSVHLFGLRPPGNPLFPFPISTFRFRFQTDTMLSFLLWSYHFVSDSP